MENIRFLTEDEMLLVAGGLTAAEEEAQRQRDQQIETITVTACQVPTPQQYYAMNTTTTTYSSTSNMGISIAGGSASGTVTKTFIDTNHDGKPDTNQEMTSAYSLFAHNNATMCVSL